MGIFRDVSLRGCFGREYFSAFWERLPSGEHCLFMSAWRCRSRYSFGQNYSCLRFKRCEDKRSGCCRHLEIHAGLSNDRHLFYSSEI